MSTYKIAKELNRPINTITNEIRRGTTTQIKRGKSIQIYLADTGNAIYEKNRQNSCCTFKRLECSEFINYTVDKFKNASWSLDSCVGYALETILFERLIRRFIPKGNLMSDYDCTSIAFIEDWMNTLPRRILGYKTPEDLFESHLDVIYQIS